LDVAIKSVLLLFDVTLKLMPVIVPVQFASPDISITAVISTPVLGTMIFFVPDVEAPLYVSVTL
jgi:hypothetical protein